MWNALPAHLKGSEDFRSFSTELLHALNDEKLTISLYLNKRRGDNNLITAISNTSWIDICVHCIHVL